MKFISTKKLPKFHILLVFSVSFFCVPLGLTCAQTGKMLLPYLVNNQADLTNANPDWNKVFTGDEYAKDIFLVGERHGVAYSYDALWMLFRQFKAKTNFKYYIIETPLYWEKYLNLYLSTGDERYLKLPFHEAKGTFYANQPFYNYFKKVYAFNIALPKKDRIHFISVDVEHQYRYAHQMLKQLVNSQLNNIDDTCAFSRLFLALDPGKTGAYQQAYLQYQKAFEKDSIQLKHLFASRYDTIKYLIRNINYKFVANADAKDLVRDSLMYENFVTRTKGLDLNRGKVFGFMGVDHCYQDGDEKKHYFGSYFSKSGYKVSSVIMLYSNCSTLIPVHYLPKPIRFFWENSAYFETKWRSNDRLIEHQRYIGVLKDAAISDITLFSLDGSQSPFNSLHAFLSDFKGEKPTINYMQYVVLIKNSPAAVFANTNLQ